MKFLIAGLGNPGSEYALTRHNIGFMIADALVQHAGASFISSRYAFYASFKFRGKQVHVIKPTTYMNLSGKAVNYYLQVENILPENMMVVTDDIALPFGKIRIRSKGSDGGHNGLHDIIETIQTSAFPRLRFGIGNDYQKGRQADYVLSPFNESEKQTLPERIKICTEAIHCFISAGITHAMNDFNKK
ncbi:MAG: aminoacyl-tRNA hydrolase [Bacteroidia bacterium]|nr:aminoacyl-tRNA hydrolase [Bacteroidia bacterium]